MCYGIHVIHTEVQPPAIIVFFCISWSVKISEIYKKKTKTVRLNVLVLTVNNENEFIVIRHKIRFVWR